MKIELANKDENLICALFFLPQINYYVAAVLSSYGVQTITPFIYFFLILAGSYSALKNLKYKQCLLWSLGILVVLLLSVIANWNTTEYMMAEPFISSPVIMLLTIYFPIYLTLITSVNLSKLVNLAVNYSIVTIVWSAIAFTNYVFILKQSIPDYMTFAYMIVSPVMFCTISAIQWKRINWIWATVGYLLILIGGCRGALLTVSFFLSLCFVRFFTTSGKRRTIIVKCIVVLLLLLVATNFDAILNGISKNLEGFGYESRVFASLMGKSYGGEVNTFFSGDGRKDIWKMAWDHIRIIGYGVFGDRTVVKNEYNNPSYAHNWMLEMLVSFGWIAGLLAIIFVLWIVLKCIVVAIRSKNTTLVLLSYSTFCIIMIKHFISASFVSSIDFWFYLGIGYCVIETVKNVRGTWI